MQKNSLPGRSDEPYEIQGIVYLLAFLMGVLLFLFFGKTVLGVEPNLVWIAVLMGLSVSAVVFWVWGQVRKKNKDEDDD